MIYNAALGDYQKNGKWKFYDESRKLKEEKLLPKEKKEKSSFVSNLIPTCRNDFYFLPR